MTAGINTRLRRASAVNPGFWWRDLLPVPDGSINTPPKWFLLGGVYAGFASEWTPVAPGTNGSWTSTSAGGSGSWTSTGTGGGSGSWTPVVT